MKTLVLLWAILYALFTPVSAYDNWTSIAQSLERSLAHLTLIASRPHPLTGDMVDVPSSCTAFAIRLDGTFVSAAHCSVGRDLKIDGHVVDVLETNKDLDILVLRVPAVRKPGVTFGEDPKLGQQVATFGYGYGTEAPMLLVGHVANPKHAYPEEPGQWMTLDHPFIGGMSGGPIVNELGHVVGMASQSNDRTGWSRPVSDIKKALKKYRDD